MLHRPNPLDQKPAPAAPAIIVHTASYSELIKTQDRDIWRLMKIASLKTTPIVFTPIDDPEVRTILESMDLDLAEYYIVANQYAIKCRYVNAAFSSEMDPVINARFQQQTGMSIHDSMAIHSRYFDYCVSTVASRTTELSRVLDILQVYHIKNGIFQGFGTGEIGAFIYYLNKPNLTIPEYRKLLGSFKMSTAESPEDYMLIENLAQSLADRMTLIEKAVTEVKYHSLKTVNNNSTMDIMYHVSYLVILITGSYDNIAWLLNYYFDLGYALQDSNRIHVKLQGNPLYNASKAKQKYYQGLSNKAPDVASYLLSSQVSGLIDFIYPLRDAIQHRSFIKPLTSQRKNDVRLLIWFPEELTTILSHHFNPEEFGFDKEHKNLMNRDYYDMYIFSKKIQFLVTEMINEVLGMINQSSLSNLSPQELTAKKESMEKSQKDPWVGEKMRASIIY